MKNIENEKWEVIEHNWSDTSVMNQNNELICTLSIDDDETTEENQQEREQIVSERFKLIEHAPDMLNLLINLVRENMLSSYGEERANELIDKIIEK